MAKAKVSSKITYQQAAAAMSLERDRVIRDAQSSMRASQCFTDAKVYGFPFGVGKDYPATRILGWCRPDEDIPASCELIARIPVSNLSELQAVRMLADKMQSFPAFNCEKIA
ncbi:MAG: hypothetical protein ACK5U7_10085 [Bacteroidota bacterium]|jgi:hypothetical protein